MGLPLGQCHAQPSTMGNGCNTQPRTRALGANANLHSWGPTTRGIATAGGETAAAAAVAAMSRFLPDNSCFGGSRRRQWLPLPLQLLEEFLHHRQRVAHESAKELFGVALRGTCSLA